MAEWQHVHEFSGETAFEFGHSHQYFGYTGPYINTEYNHTHRILIIISVDEGHDHEIEVFTGPGIHTEWGHVHRFRGVTSVNGRPPHAHRFDNVVSPLIPYYYSI